MVWAVGEAADVGEAAGNSSPYVWHYTVECLAADQPQHRHHEVGSERRANVTCGFVRDGSTYRTTTENNDCSNRRK